jgi:hypothetical protein
MPAEYLPFDKARFAQPMESEPLRCARVSGRNRALALINVFDPNLEEGYIAAW